MQRGGYQGGILRPTLPASPAPFLLPRFVGTEIYYLLDGPISGGGVEEGGGRQQESLQRKIKILLVCNGCVVFAYSVYNGETRIVTIHELFRIYRYYYL